MPPFSFTLLRTTTGFAGKEPHKDTSETAMRCCRRTLREFPRLLRGNLRPILCCCARLCERKRMPARRSPGANEMSRSASASNYSHNKIGCRKQNTVHTMLMISAQAVRKVSRCASICNCFHNIDRKEQSIELTRSRLSGSGVRTSRTQHQRRTLGRSESIQFSQVAKRVDVQPLLRSWLLRSARVATKPDPGATKNRARASTGPWKSRYGFDVVHSPFSA
jgi:hypothetical protein